MVRGFVGVSRWRVRIPDGGGLLGDGGEDEGEVVGGGGVGGQVEEESEAEIGGPVVGAWCEVGEVRGGGGGWH